MLKVYNLVDIAIKVWQQQLQCKITYIVCNQWGVFLYSFRNKIWIAIKCIHGNFLCLYQGILLLCTEQEYLSPCYVSY